MIWIKQAPDGLFVGGLIVLTLALSRGLWTTHLLGGIDMEIALIKVVALMQSWADGSWLGRWSAEMNFGFGYPLLNFYSPLFFYISAGAGFLFNDPVVGMNMVLVLGYAASGVFMYLFARRLWGRAGAFFSAAAYLTAPYHIWDIYSRGVCAEFMAFAMVPMVFWAMDRLYHKGTIGAFLVAAGGAALLILTHNLTTMLVFPLVGVYMLFLFMIDRERRLTKLAGCASTLLLAMLLTAYFWMPALMEKQFVHIERMLGGYQYFKNHLMSLQNALWETWRYSGHGNKAFQLGKVHVVLAGISLMLLPLLFRRDRRLAGQVILWTGLAIVCLCLMLSSSEWVWRQVPALQLLQFSWRLYLVMSFMMAAAMGSLVYLVPQKHQVPVTIVGVVMLLLAYGGYCYPYLGTSTVKIEDRKAWLYSMRPQDAMEYIPVWVKDIPLKPTPLLSVVQGNVELIKAPDEPAMAYGFGTRSSAGGIVLLYNYYFPGRVIFIDGDRSEVLKDNPLGAMAFRVPAGEHRVDIRWERTPVQRVGETVSLVALAGFIFFWWWSRRNNGKDMILWNASKSGT